METVQTATPATPEEVWAILRENAIGMRELKERQEETARQIEELKESPKKEKDEFNKRFGKMINRFGEVVEYMIAPNLRNKFRELGFDFEQTLLRRIISLKNGKVMYL